MAEQAASLVERLRRQAEHCAATGSRLYGALLSGAADDYDRGGVTAELLRGHDADPAGSVPSLRLAGALHRLVLEGRAPELARHYPSAGGTAPADAVWPAAERAIREHLGPLRELVRAPVQTNEVGRSAVLVGALLRLGAKNRLPVRLLELGASGGLNLRVDRFGYDVAEGVVVGDPASPLVLRRPWEGSHPPYDAPLRVVERRGCDPAPIDPTTPAGRLTLASYVWADQVERLERLRAAVEVAALVPAVVERAGAAEFLRRELAEPRDDVLTVIWHSVVMQYVDPAERGEVDALLEQAGARGSRLARVALEPTSVGKGFGFAVTVTQWPGGRPETWAGCEGHGPPVVWR